MNYKVLFRIERLKLIDKLNNAYVRDLSLIDERKNVNAVQSMQQTEQELVKEEEKTQDEKEVDAKEETKQITLEKAREEIQKEKASDGNKANEGIKTESHEKVSVKSEHTVSSR